MTTETKLLIVSTGLLLAFCGSFAWACYTWHMCGGTP